MRRDLVLTVDYTAEPQIVWRAITDSTLLARWLMKNDFRAEVGARGQFDLPKKPGFDGVIKFEVIEVDEPKRLVYTWDGGGAWGKTTLIWTLEASSTGTRLRLEHQGFEGLKPFLLSVMMGSGWKSKLTGLVREIVQELVKEI